MSRPNRIPAITDESDAERLLRQLQRATETILEPTAAEEALEFYLEDKARECRKSTVDSHRSRLGFFVEWCESINAVQPGLFKKIKSPTIPDEKVARETTLHVSRGKEIVTHLDRFEYAWVEHVGWLLLTETSV
ncbi:hypothetical protein Htur_4048 (plasmid) [Haloterrigena turkmenica DSM 5511]|uniref:Core-binding (CB) domain-containing protein n=1 Tax=Haloterrigena turkmenica (strain ATCC 51198 / DSM 5511 / JCM 9101 / NCIMB 13204 / VKM B-1734 / 4k) TaxID=543526 RepID=D2S0J1_HALTV|nr:hypothetical protein [Haloterrigena turkmenica]ADB62888.1 hypothetical protein Htur_4048 [Haloterrigena turkmenica DSM 5511]